MQNFKIAKLQHFKVSKLQNFKTPKFQISKMCGTRIFNSSKKNVQKYYFENALGLFLKLI